MGVHRNTARRAVNKSFRHTSQTRKLTNFLQAGEFGFAGSTHAISISPARDFAWGFVRTIPKCGGSSRFPSPGSTKAIASRRYSSHGLGSRTVDQIGGACNLAYSTLVFLSSAISGSASFQSAKKSS